VRVLLLLVSFALAGEALSAAAPQAASPAPEVPERIAEIRIHGNLIVTNEEVLAIGGVAVGDPFSASTLQEVASRLRASKKFDDVQVLKRFASLEDPARIALVIIVNEGPVRLSRSGPNGTLTPVRRRGFRNLMFLPIIDAEDGYGLTYGVRFAVVNKAGGQSRLSFPLSWGGTKRAAAEMERRFDAGPITRIQFGAGVQRRENPAYHQDDSRQRIWARAERAFGPLRAGGNGGWQHVSFAALTDQIRSIGADVAFDTRHDPLFPRNAVFVTAGVDHLWFASGDSRNLVALQADGYAGVWGQMVLALRVSRDAADGPLPPYLKPLLGGWSSVRGYEAGAYVGDTVVTESAELRVPLTSSLRIAKLGVSAFVDAGKAYDFGQRYREQPLRVGVGGGVWLTATVFRLGLSVAHGQDSGTRVNFGGGITF